MPPRPLLRPHPFPASYCCTCSSTFRASDPWATTLGPEPLPPSSTRPGWGAAAPAPTPADPPSMIADRLSYGRPATASGYCRRPCGSPSCCRCCCLRLAKGAGGGGPSPKARVLRVPQGPGQQVRVEGVRGPPMAPPPSRRTRCMRTRARSSTSLYGNGRRHACIHKIVDALQRTASRATYVGYPSTSPSALPAYSNEVRRPRPTVAAQGGGGDGYKLIEHVHLVSSSIRQHGTVRLDTRGTTTHCCSARAVSVSSWGPAPASSSCSRDRPWGCRRRAYEGVGMASARCTED